MRVPPPNIALTGLAAELERRASEGRPIRIGLVGTGEMGTDIFTQVAQMRGIRVGAVVERTPGRAALGADMAYGEPGHTRGRRHA
jgi:predicted homoserine dehydrogenase-like protein